ncbi:haloacid dehalogenase type II [Methylobacterium iners]|uniref:(S)-2-haloacid dehalogenase n=1 Tax=Methylobacterium iners TaxID=418707 RepID=A0ABQ4RYY0_9HYPH|nr:haloacid dehalogenase type II [Methylobacterium iners]GJD94889.1 (S)-2-haloacid dehalogenase 4A [Methylobacterium iners]
MSGSDLIPEDGIAVFDAYGTLFDVHSAVMRHAAGIGTEAMALSETWRAKQLEYTWTLSLMGRSASFWTLTERALDFALARHPGIDPGIRPKLLGAYRDLDAYPEAAGVIRSLRQRRIATAILSNGDAAMLARAMASAGLDDAFDSVLSVEASGIFKTSPVAYQIVLDRFGVSPGGVVFCSSNRWDVAGAVAFGFSTVWVNRTGLPDEYPDLAPTRIVTSLDGIL